MTAQSHTLDVGNLEASLKNSDSYVRDILNFFEEGWDARGVDDKKQFENRLKANVVSTLTYLNEVIGHLSDAGLTAKGAHIKLENPNSLSVIVSLSVEDYMSDKLSDVYQKMHAIEKSSRSDNYRVAFNLTYDDNSLNHETLKAEGYVQTL